MIHIDRLSFIYKNGGKALSDVSFNIARGEFVALIGQNGSGKTTLLKHLNGLLKPSSGNVSINGNHTRNIKTSSLSKHIGFLFQNPDHQIFCNTVYEEIAFGLKNIEMDRSRMDERIKEAAGMVRLEAFLDAAPFSLSKGQRQRVALASVIAMDTEILVLDEPTTGQDYKQSTEIMDIILKLNREGKTILTVTHDMELVARYAGRVIIMRNGSVVEDGPVERVLERRRSLASSGLEQPQICELAARFHIHGMFKNVYTAEQMLDGILYYIGDKDNACNG